MDGLTNGGGAQHHFIQPEPALSLSKNSAPNSTSCREDCKNPRLMRPSPEGMAVDVFATVRQFGFPIQVLSDYTQAMNRYAFLLVE
jgi:predicted metal-binding protein